MALEGLRLRPTKYKPGQPTKYEPEHCRAIIDFFDQEPYEDVDLPHYQKDGETIKWKDVKRMPRKLPTLVEFARSINVCYATVYNWQDKNHGSYQEKFLEAFTRAKDLQKNWLIQNGLQGLYNPIFAKFVAINITDMEDKAKYEVESSTLADIAARMGCNGDSSKDD